MHRTLLKHVLLILFFFIVTPGTRAQDPFREFKMTHWDSRKGMPNHLLLSIFPTSEGFIWLSGYFGGLSLAYDIIKAHGGEIKVNTIEGEGTEFIIQLPMN